MLAGFFLCVFLLRENQYVYYWDSGGYWTNSYTYMNYLFQSPSAAISMLYSSILNLDYNYLLPALIALPLKVFGYTFSTYVLINYVVFLVPAMFVVYSILKKLHASSQCIETTVYGKWTSTGIIHGSLILLLCFTNFFMPMLHGFIDVACLLPESLSMLLMIDYDAISLNKRQVFKDILLALLLLSSCLFRRYFAFYVVGYAVGLTLMSVYKAWVSCRGVTGQKKNHVRMHAFFSAAANLLIIAGVFLTILLLLFRPFFLKAVTNTYAQQYEGYDTYLLTKIKELVIKFGWVVIIMDIFGLLLSFWTRRYRCVIAFCGVTAVVSVASFFRIQNMGPQHVYIISVPVFLMTAIGMEQLSLIPKKKCLKSAVAVACVVVMAAGFANCYFPESCSALKPASSLFSMKYYPLRRNDISQLHEMADYLNSMTEATGKHIYVCASGHVLNYSLLQSLDKPYAETTVNNLLVTSDVDLRDGFPAQFFTADIIVVTQPVQLHLAEGTQEVVRFLAEEVMDNHSPIGRHFQKTEKSFSLDKNIIAYVYEKTSEYTPDDIQYIADYYSSLYPDYNWLFYDRITGRTE